MFYHQHPQLNQCINYYGYFSKKVRRGLQECTYSSQIIFIRGVSILNTKLMRFDKLFYILYKSEGQER